MLNNCADTLKMMAVNEMSAGMPTTTLITPTSMALPMPLPLLLTAGGGAVPAWARCFAAFVRPEKNDGSLAGGAVGGVVDAGTACTEPVWGCCDSKHNMAGAAHTGVHELADEF